MISARVSSKLEGDAARAARTVGLSISDLVRVGLQRVVDEIAAKRCITLQPQEEGLGRGLSLTEMNTKTGRTTTK